MTNIKKKLLEQDGFFTARMAIGTYSSKRKQRLAAAAMDTLLSSGEIVQCGYINADGCLQAVFKKA